jgi:putative ABC transport system substrate-binding protein
MCLVAATVLVGILPVGAQSSGYRVAVLTPGVTYAPVLEGLREGLSKLGYHEGKDINFIVDETKADVSDLGSRAKKLVEAKPDVLVAVTTPHTAAAKQATTTIPIVFVWVGDPLRSGLIASYASSKNNLTGVAAYSGPLAAKRLEILKEIVPGIKRVLAVVTTKDSVAETSFQSVSETAKKLGVQVVRNDVTTKEEIEKVISETAKGSVEAIYAAPSALVGVHIGLLIKKSKEAGLPLVVWENSMVEQGALFTYGGDIRHVGAQSAKLVSKVLRGAKPVDVPTEIPEKLMLVINLSTARAIGLKIPAPVLERADRRIE